MNLLDLVLLFAAVCYAFSGYRQGFIVGSASTLGLLLGGYVGVRLSPILLDSFDSQVWVSMAALGVVIGLAILGQSFGALAGAQLRSRVQWHPARVVDALSGAGLSVVAMLLIAWVLGVAASGVQLRGLNEAVRDSTVLGAVDQALPGGSDRILSTFTAVVDSSRFPLYLDPLTRENIADVPAPTGAVVGRPGVVRAANSVVKILGDASACDRSLEGSGFVYAAGHVMTNAHVVAGVDSPSVVLRDAEYDAEVVYYDPDIDVAVLAVPDLPAPTLAFDTEGKPGDSAAVLGFPDNGPYSVGPARLRDEQRLRSPNIYGDTTVIRETWSIYANVRPGNSGGPLVSPRGDVLGVVFAASITDDSTGYALTADQVSAAAAAGRTAADPVDTGDCAA